MSSNFTDQFRPNEAWLVFPVESLVENELMYIYSMMDVASTYVFGSLFIPKGMLPDSEEVFELFQNAYRAKNEWPKTIYFSEQDPAEKIFRKYSKEKSILFELTSLTNFQDIIDPFEELLKQNFN